MNGNGQAVRIPARPRIDADRVAISRTADGDLLLHPVPLSRGRALLEVLEGFDDEFVALLEHRPPAVAARIDALDVDDTVCMSFITFAEMLGGAERSSRKPEVGRRLEQLTHLVPVAFPGGRSICHHHAARSTRPRAAGMPIGADDLWIGCHALAESAVLVTNNEREFRRLAGLSVENRAAA